MIETAAARLFAEHGYDGTRLDDIAAAAGVSKPILYRHFASKTDLYVALLERHRADLPTFVAPDDLGMSLAEHLPAILDGWFAYVETRPFTWKMLFRDSGGDAAVLAERAAVLASARAVMEAIVGSVPSVPRDQVVPTAELIRNGMAGLALWWMDHPEVPRATVVAATAPMWHGLLRRPAPARRPR